MPSVARAPSDLPRYCKFLEVANAPRSQSACGSILNLEDVAIVFWGSLTCRRKAHSSRDARYLMTGVSSSAYYRHCRGGASRSRKRLKRCTGLPINRSTQRRPSCSQCPGSTSKIRMCSVWAPGRLHRFMPGSCQTPAFSGRGNFGVLIPKTCALQPQAVQRVRSSPCRTTPMYLCTPGTAERCLSGFVSRIAF